MQFCTQWVPIKIKTIVYLIAIAADTRWFLCMMFGQVKAANTAPLGNDSSFSLSLHEIVKGK
jgi:hypothetical protein